MPTVFHTTYGIVRQVLPHSIARKIRSFVTAFIGPEWHACRSGHWRSAFLERAVDRKGNPIPWYSYPCIDLLMRRDFSGRRVLEFGGGQSTAWWSTRAGEVVTLDDEPAWIRPAPNVTVLRVLQDKDCAVNAAAALAGSEPFDIIVIDGLKRAAHVPLALRMRKSGGAIIVDNASTAKGVFDAFRDSGLSRVDFYGLSPGVLMTQCTSVFFHQDCFLFDGTAPIKPS